MRGCVCKAGSCTRHYNDILHMCGGFVAHDFNGVLACFSTGQIPPSKQQRTCYKVFKATLFAISKSGYCAHSAHNAEHKFAGFHNKTDASAGKAKILLFILEKLCYNSIAKFF